MNVSEETQQQLNPTKENDMAANPKGYTKAMLLAAVESLNAIADTKLKVKSKTVAQMVDPIADAIRKANLTVIADDLDQDSMECFIAFNILGEGFCDEDAYSDKLIKGLKSVEDDTVQAETAVVFEESDEDEDEDDTSEVEESEEDGDEDEGSLEEQIADIEEEIEEMEEELEETTKKKKKKKIQSEINDLQDELAELRALLEEDTKKKEEAKPEKKSSGGDPIVEAAKTHIADLKAQLEGDLKKKKRKKLQKQLDEAEADLAEILKDKGGDKKPETKPNKKKRPGVIATIGEILQDSDEYLSAEQILEQLTERLPEGNPDTMIKTVKAQLYCRQAPCRMEKEKGIAIKIKGEGTARTFKAK